MREIEEKMILRPDSGGPLVVGEDLLDEAVGRVGVLDVEDGAVLGRRDHVLVGGEGQAVGVAVVHVDQVADLARVGGEAQLATGGGLREKGRSIFLAPERQFLCRLFCAGVRGRGFERAIKGKKNLRMGGCSSRSSSSPLHCVFAEKMLEMFCAPHLRVYPILLLLSPPPGVQAVWPYFAPHNLLRGLAPHRCTLILRRKKVTGCVLKRYGVTFW